MKKLLMSLGSIAAITAPIAAVVSCNSTIKAPFKTDDMSTEKQKEFFDNWATINKAELSIENSPSLKNMPNLSGDDVQKHWNKPEGSILRLGIIANEIGHEIWGYQNRATPEPGDAVVRSLIFGVINDMKKNGEINAQKLETIARPIIEKEFEALEDPQNNYDPYPEAQWRPVADAKVKSVVEEQVKKLASTKLNTYKVDLINNIDNTINKYDALSSPAKFQAFLKWLVLPINKYANLRETLMGGKINNNFIQGVQDELNKPSDTGLITPQPGKTDIVVIQPTP